MTASIATRPAETRTPASTDPANISLLDHEHAPAKISATTQGMIPSAPAHSLEAAKSPDPGFPANGSVTAAKAYMKAHPPKGNDPSRWTKDQNRAFNVLAQDFGKRHSPHHVAWHEQNGPGGTQVLLAPG